MTLLLYSLTNGDTYWVVPEQPPPVPPLLVSHYVNNIGGPRHFVGSHTNILMRTGVSYALDPISSQLLANGMPVGPLTYLGERFVLDFFTFGFCVDQEGEGIGFYLGRRGDSNQDCLWSINLSNAQMTFYGCLNEFGNPTAAVNGLTVWNGVGYPIWEGELDQVVVVE
jgi:hypothetical protein